MKEAMTIPKTASILIPTVARTLINMSPRRSYLLHMAIMRQIFPPPMRCGSAMSI